MWKQNFLKMLQDISGGHCNMLPLHHQNRLANNQKILINYDYSVLLEDRPVLHLSKMWICS